MVKGVTATLPIRHTSFAFCFTFSLLSAVGCRTARAPETPMTTALNGRSSYEAVPDDSPSKLIPQLDYIPAAPAAENSPPAYPEGLVKMRLSPQKLVVRLVVNREGQVAEVLPSRIPSEVDPAYRAAFEAAITSAVQLWRFTPGRRRTFVDGPDLDGNGRASYQVLQSEKPAPTYFDVRFTFEVHEGKGLVRSSQ